MSAGPPRFGLRPTRGLHPGSDPLYDTPAELRTIHYPGAAVYPGRGAYPFARFITRPSTAIYPGTDLLIRGAPRHFSVGFVMRGLGQLVARRLNFHGSRKLALFGQGRLVLLSNAGVRPHSTAVQFADGRGAVPYEGRTRAVRFASTRRKVTL